MRLEWTCKDEWSAMCVACNKRHGKINLSQSVRVLNMICSPCAARLLLSQPSFTGKPWPAQLVNIISSA